MRKTEAQNSLIELGKLLLTEHILLFIAFQTPFLALVGFFMLFSRFTVASKERWGLSVIDSDMSGWNIH